jgi:hypothetical protein
VRPHFWSLRAAVSTLLAQNPILLGLFFTVPLYLQVVQGLDAFRTGLRLLPVSVLMLVAAAIAPLLTGSPARTRWCASGSASWSSRPCLLLATVRPELDNLSSGMAMRPLTTEGPTTTSPTPAPP